MYIHHQIREILGNTSDLPPLFWWSTDMNNSIQKYKDFWCLLLPEIYLFRPTRFDQTSGWFKTQIVVDNLNLTSISLNPHWLCVLNIGMCLARQVFVTHVYSKVSTQNSMLSVLMLTKGTSWLLSGDVCPLSAKCQEAEDGKERRGNGNLRIAAFHPDQWQHQAAVLANGRPGAGLGGVLMRGAGGASVTSGWSWRISLPRPRLRLPQR